MSFSQDLVTAEGASVNVSESAGKVVLSASVSRSLGGGSAEGVVGVSGQISISISAKQLLILAFDLLKSKSPAGLVMIEAEVEAAALAAMESL